MSLLKRKLRNQNDDGLNHLLFIVLRTCTSSLASRTLFDGGGNAPSNSTGRNFAARQLNSGRYGLYGTLFCVLIFDSFTLRSARGLKKSKQHFTYRSICRWFLREEKPLCGAVSMMLYFFLLCPPYRVEAYMHAISHPLLSYLETLILPI